MADPASSTVQPSRDADVPELRAHAADVEAIAAVKNGDKDAFATLYDRYAAVAFGLAHRMLPSSPDAEAVVAEVFLEFWRAPQGFDASRGSLETYLLVRTRSRALDYIRRESRRGAAHARLADHAEHRVAAGPTSERPEHAAMGCELNDQLREALEELGPEQRTPLLLAFFDGLTHREIAEQLGVPLGTTKSRIRAAIRVLRGRLSRFGGSDDDMP